MPCIPRLTFYDVRASYHVVLFSRYYLFIRALLDFCRLSQKSEVFAEVLTQYKKNDTFTSLLYSAINRTCGNELHELRLRRNRNHRNRDGRQIAKIESSTSRFARADRSRAI